MKLLPLFLLGLLGLFFITLVSVKFNQPVIESELTENTHEALLSEGMDWATPSANGQTITLKGIADNNERRLQAESIAQAVNGVVRVNNQLTVSSVENITHQADQIMVNEGDDAVDSISTITTEESSTSESAVPIFEAQVADIVEEVGSTEVIATEPIAEVATTETAVVVEEMVASIESTEPVTEIAVTEIVAEEAAESIKSADELVTDVAATEIVVVEKVIESLEPVEDATTITETVAKESPEAITTSDPVNELLNTCQQQFDQLLTNEKIRFETNSAILSAGNSQLLTKLAGVIQSCPTFKIMIEGHTDTDGAVVANQVLSEQRAYRVYDELVKRGIRSSTLLAIGYGESRPLSTENTPKSKAQNRRIELNVQEN